MGKFCTKCGRPLQEGEICSCQQRSGMNTNWQQPHQMQQGVQMQQNPRMQQIPMQSQPSAASDFFRKFFTTFIGIMKKPVTEGRNLILQADVKIAVVFLILQGIFSALFALVVSSKCGSYIDMLIGLAGGSSSYGSNLAYASMFKLPYARIFFVTLIASVALSCVLALLLMLGHMVVKNKVNYVQMLSVVAIRSVLLIPVTLLSILVFQLHTTAGLFLFFIGGIWGFVAMSLSMTSYRTDDEKNGYAGMISIVALVFVLITFFAMTKLWGYYLPDMIRTALDELKNTISNPGVLMEELMDEIF